MNGNDDLFAFGEKTGAEEMQKPAADPVTGETENETAVVKCPACGANMVYDSESGSLYCEHCGTEKEIIARNSEELAFERLLEERGGWEDGTRVFRCENCGAKEVLHGGEIAKTCPFCGTSNVVVDEELPGLKPNAVVPFRIGENDASAGVKKWIRKRIFAPRKFRKSAKPQELSGVYMPAFTFDTFTESDYVAVLGRYYYTTRRVNGRTVQQRHVRYFTVSGRYSMPFDDVLIQASDRIDQNSLNKLQPFETNASKEYTGEYLSGYSASQYTKDGLACWDEAKSVIRGRLKTAVLGQYTYDVVSSFHINTRCNKITYKYILLPVYVGHCSWRKKLYNFFVNGINGIVTGRAPVSPLKVSGLVILCAGALVGLYFLFRFLMS